MFTMTTDSQQINTFPILDYNFETLLNRCLPKFTFYPRAYGRLCPRPEPDWLLYGKNLLLYRKMHV